MAIFIFASGRIFDGHSGELIEGGCVVVEGGEIREISARPVRLPGAVVIDCDGHTIMPGLIDAHVHAFLTTSDFEAVDRMPKSLLSQYGAAALRGALERGFTTVRDACGADHGLVMALERGLIRGPRLLISGKGISQTGGHGDGRAAHHEATCGCGYVGALTLVADGADAVRKAVREELRKGASQIKIFASGGVTSPTDPIWMPQFTHDEIRAAVEEAATRRTYVMAHCHTSDSARRCIEAGVRSIEHGSDIDAPTAALIRDAGAFVVPTLSIAAVGRDYGAALGFKEENLRKLNGLLEKMYASIEQCARSSVKLGLGTDLPGNFAQHQSSEFRLRKNVQSSLEVLRSATSVNAELLQMQGRIGCLAPGACADILVVEGDPLADVAVLSEPERSLRLIMAGGSIVKNSLACAAQ
jgi:imidazolonepropionase-like amidohydrolase